MPLGRRRGMGRVVLAGGLADLVHIDCSPVQGSIQQDLTRRDFTIDALAVPLASFDGDWARAALIDPHGGEADLKAGLIRMVSPEVLEADPLRLLRAVRLMAELGLRIEAATAAAIKERAPVLATSAPERLREELCRILAAEGAATWLEALDQLDLLEALLPGLEESKGVGQPKEHYWDVFAHQLETVAAVEALVERKVSPKLGNRRYLMAVVECSPWHPALEGYFLRGAPGSVGRGTLLKLAALLHDVAKPATKTIEPDGRMRFFGHSELGAHMAEAMLTRLRFSNQEVRAVARMVTHHLRPGQWSATPPTERALSRYFRDLGDTALDTIFLSLGDHLAARGPALEIEDWRRHVEVVDQVLGYYLEQRERVAAPRLVTGHDLMEAFGLEPGPHIGRLLAGVEEAFAAGAVQSKEDALALVAQDLHRGRTVVGLHRVPLSRGEEA